MTKKIPYNQIPDALVNIKGLCDLIHTTPAPIEKGVVASAIMEAADSIRVACILKDMEYLYEQKRP